MFHNAHRIRKVRPISICRLKLAGRPNAMQPYTPTTQQMMAQTMGM